MSQDENKSNAGKSLSIDELLSQVKVLDVEPSPYLMPRTLAHMDFRSLYQRKIIFWRSLSVFFSVVLMVFVFYSPLFFHKWGETEKVINQAYVLHVDFSQETRETRIAQVEISLPHGLSFVSHQHVVADLKNLRLPFSPDNKGKVRLPFVVQSSTQGSKWIYLKFLDEDNELVKEKKIKVSFAKEQKTMQ